MTDLFWKSKYNVHIIYSLLIGFEFFLQKSVFDISKLFFL